MIALNLMSQAQKDVLRARVVYALLERAMGVLVATFLVVCTALFALKVRLTDVLGQLVSRQILSTQYVAVNSDLRRLNVGIATVDAIQNGFTPLSTLTVDLIRRTPASVALTGLRTDLLGGTVQIEGSAALRDDLLAYEQALKASPYVTAVESPISNLFNRKNVEFTLSVTLDLEALRKSLDPEAP